MKTARRHELQTNVLADWLGEKIETLKPYAKLALGLVVAAGVLTAFYFVMTGRSKEAEARGWDQYFKALDSSDPQELEAVAQEFAGTSVGHWSHLRLGNVHLSDGIDALFHERAKANEELRAAAESFRAAAASDEPAIGEQAAFGLAKTYESQRELDKALAEYKLLIERWPNGPFAKMAQQRIDDLSSRSTKEFYDWFSEQNPSPALHGEPGTPGERPAFSLEGLEESKEKPTDGFDSQVESLLGTGMSGKDADGKKKIKPTPDGGERPADPDKAPADPDGVSDPNATESIGSPDSPPGDPPTEGAPSDETPGETSTETPADPDPPEGDTPDSP